MYYNNYKIGGEIMRVDRVKLIAEMARQEIKSLELAEKAGSSKCANTVMLGALCRILNEPEEKMLDIVSGLVPPKTVEMNKAAFKLGYERGQN